MRNIFRKVGVSSRVELARTVEREWAPRGAAPGGRIYAQPLSSILHGLRP